MFLVLWEYEVKPGFEQRFERVYGPGVTGIPCFGAIRTMPVLFMFRGNRSFSRVSHHGLLALPQILRRIPGSPEQHTIIRRGNRGSDSPRAARRAAGNRRDLNQFGAHSATRPSARSSGCTNRCGRPSLRNSASAAR